VIAIELRSVGAESSDLQTFHRGVEKNNRVFFAFAQKAWTVFNHYSSQQFLDLTCFFRRISIQFLSSYCNISRYKTQCKIMEFCDLGIMIAVATLSFPIGASASLVTAIHFFHGTF